MTARAALAALAVAGAGCRELEDPGFPEPIRAARLRGVGTAGATLVAGVWSGSGRLELEGTDGVVREVTVQLSGSNLGVGAELGAQLGGFPLQLPRGRVVGNDVFGRYAGSTAGLVVGVGVEAHHLKNRADVEIDAASLGLGVSVNLGAEWMTVRGSAGSPDDPGVDDTGAPTDDTAAPEAP